MSGQCQNLMIRCMDFRLQQAVEKWLLENGYAGEIDNVAIAGASKEIIGYGSTCQADFVMQMINLAHEKHGVRKIILTQHEDCGAYGGQKAFASAEAEKSKLLADMKKAKEILLAKYPDIQVLTFWVKKVGEGWQIEAVSL